jgi:hypothetical protein
MSSKPTDEPLPAELPPHAQAALALLLEGNAFAETLRVNTEVFAVEFRTLREAGCTPSALRWLACRGYVEHTTESLIREGKRGQPAGMARLTFTDESCFLLTAAGLEYARSDCGARRLDGPHAATGRAGAPAAPHWDAARRQLCWGELVVKQFFQPAPSQQTLLAAFEEDGWPPRIDNPLPPRGKQEGWERLHDAIIRLNRCQRHPVLRFFRDGSGEGACWQPRQGSGTGASLAADGRGGLTK